MTLHKFIREKRMASGLTQFDLAKKAGVGLRFVRELEQGKETLRLNTVNQVLKLFGFELGPVELDRNYVLGEDQAPDGENATGISKKKKA